MRETCAADAPARRMAGMSDWAAGGEVMVCGLPAGGRQPFCPEKCREDIPRSFKVKM